jgi:lipopolysaccharide export system permease protein
MARQYRTITLYIARAILISFLIGFLFFFFIFFVNQLLLRAEQILAKKVPLWDVVLIIFYSIPLIVTYALPFGVLVGALMAVGQLASGNEVLALRASGVSPMRVFLPLLILGLALSVVSFIFSDLFLPLGNIRLKTMLRRVLFTNPAVELEPYTVERYDSTVIIPWEVSETEITGIAIIDETEDNKKRVITATRASVEPNPLQKGAVSLKLDGVFVHVSDPEQSGTFEYTSADSMVYNLLLKDISISMVSPGPAEKSFLDVWEDIRERRLELQSQEERHEELVQKLRFQLMGEIRAALKIQDSEDLQRLSQLARDLRREESRPVLDRNLQAYSLEFHRKFAAPLSCLAFIILAFPVGLYARRSGRALGFGVGVVMSGLYWGLLLVAFRVATQMNVPPMLAMWIPNLVVMLAGGVLLMRRLAR